VLAPRDQNLALESILRQPRPWLLALIQPSRQNANTPAGLHSDCIFIIEFDVTNCWRGAKLWKPFFATESARLRHPSKKRHRFQVLPSAP
jgi:hypothetical protein